MTTDALWFHEVGTVRHRSHFFWWPNTITYWEGKTPRERTYFWETVILTERCCKSFMGNFWKVIAVNGQTLA